MFKKRFDPVEKRVAVTHLICKEFSNGRFVIAVKTLDQSAVHFIQVPHGRANIMDVFLYQLHSKPFNYVITATAAVLQSRHAPHRNLSFKARSSTAGTAQKWSLSLINWPLIIMSSIQLRIRLVKDAAWHLTH